MDFRPPASSDHGILQARIQEWVAISLSRGSLQSRDQTHVSCISCIGKWVLYQYLAPTWLNPPGPGSPNSNHYTEFYNCLFCYFTPYICSIYLNNIAWCGLVLCSIMKLFPICSRRTLLWTSSNNMTQKLVRNAESRALAQIHSMRISVLTLCLHCTFGEALLFCHWDLSKLLHVGVVLGMSS